MNPSNVVLETDRIVNDRYCLGKILGQGSFGAAFLAEDIKLKRGCVVKQMTLPTGRSDETMALYYNNFEREASLLAQLNHPGHPNIPEIYDYFSDPEGTYLVMKYIEGQSLADILEPPDSKMPWQDAVRYMIDICSAVHYMHTVGDQPVIHRDIKPANILLGLDERVWLVDFGLAKAKPVQGSGSLMETQSSGSIGYTPLEQWFGEAGPAADVYAIGATLHHMVTGLHPARDFGEFFDFDKLNNLHGSFAPIRDIEPDLPKPLEAVIAAATAAEPEHRPAPKQLQQELEALIIGPKSDVLFTFQNGEVAKDNKTLVALCQANWPEAEGYLYNGDFARWFRLINRNDLAEAAEQAVKTGKNQKDGLKKFLKQVLPSLWLRQLGKAFLRIIRLSMLVTFIITLLGLILAVAGVYASRLVVQRAISTHDWRIEGVGLEMQHRFTEEMINDQFDVLQRFEAESGYDVYLDFQAPSQIEVYLNDIKLPILVLISLEDGKPHFYLVGLDNGFLFWVTGNLSRGINHGIDQVFEQTIVDVVDLVIDEDGLVFRLQEREITPQGP